jgi:DNA repair ATPase RecN
LLKALKDLSQDNQVVTTTHSPVFAGATDVEGVYVPKEVNNYENVADGNEQDFF